MALLLSPLPLPSGALAALLAAAPPASRSPPTTDESVREACTQCHAWAPPEMLPRDSWRQVVSDMNESSLLGHGLGGEMGGLWQYNLHQITRYFVERAPETLPPPEAWPPPGDAAERFARRGLHPDLDALMTNGDSLDDQLVKPYHGVGWLENRGGFPWVRHELVGLPGVHRAQAADMDGDGDLDVVAAAFLLDPANPDAHRSFASLVLLERLGTGEFRRHTLESGRLLHATLDLADVDGDGDVDIAVGNLGGYSSADAPAALTAGAPWVEIWENRGTGAISAPQSSPGAASPKRK